MSLQLAMYINLKFISSWWGGAFSILIGFLGVVPWQRECTRIYHRAFALFGILMNAVAAVMEGRVVGVLGERGLFCGGPLEDGELFRVCMCVCL